jgi:hypothetical protein
MARIQLRPFTNVLRDQMEEQVYLLSNQLLAHVATDYNLDHSELVEKYLGKPPRAVAVITDGKDQPATVLVAAQQKVQAKRAQKPKPDKVMCKGITAKGQPCKFGACGPEGLCKKHLQAQQKEGTAPRKTAKVQKPRHEHLVEEEAETCQVCETHGNVTNPEMPRETFEIRGAEEIQDRLKRILAEAEEEPEEAALSADELAQLTEPPTETLTESQDEMAEKMAEEEEPNEEEGDDLQSRLRAILSEDTDCEDDE